MCSVSALCLLGEPRLFVLPHKTGLGVCCCVFQRLLHRHFYQRTGQAEALRSRIYTWNWSSWAVIGVFCRIQQPVNKQLLQLWIFLCFNTDMPASVCHIAYLFFSLSFTKKVASEMIVSSLLILQRSEFQCVFKWLSSTLVPLMHFSRSAAKLCIFCNLFYFPVLPLHYESVQLNLLVLSTWSWKVI